MHHPYRRSPSGHGVSSPLQRRSTFGAGFAVGTGATAVLKTTTGGASWAAVSSPLCKNLYAVDFTSATTGYAVGRTSAGTAPTVLKTTNGAASWTAVK